VTFCSKGFVLKFSGQEKLKADYTGYDAKSAKQGNLASALDKPVPPPSRGSEATNFDNNTNYFMEGRETKSTKQMFLASNDPATGSTSLQGYDLQKNAEPEFIDWVVSGLPPNFEAPQLKKIAQVKHVVEATVEEDNFKGTCTGNGRIKIRLNHGESAEQVRLNFLRRGFGITEFKQDPRKRPDLTGPPKDFGTGVTNAKVHKQTFLST